MNADFYSTESPIKFYVIDKSFLKEPNYLYALPWSDFISKFRDSAIKYYQIFLKHYPNDTIAQQMLFQLKAK